MHRAAYDKGMQPARLMDQVFSIALGENKHLIYHPLKRIAFVANAALVNAVVDRCQAPPNQADMNELGFLECLDFFAPSAIPADPWAETGVRYDAVVLFLTNECNLRCTYCYASAGEHTKSRMPWEIAKAAIDQVAAEVRKHDLPSMSLGFHGGGEPTMNWPILKRAVEYARDVATAGDLRLQVSGAFNGYWTDVVREFMLAHFTDISLSFDGLPSIQGTQRPTVTGGSSYSRLEDTLKALDASQVKYGIRMTVTKHSLACMLEGILYICANFKPAKIQVEPVFLAGRARENGLGVDDMDEFISHFIRGFKVARDAGIELFYSGARLEALTRRFCTAACNALVVTPEGKITACFETFGSEHPLSERFYVGSYSDGAFHIDPSKLRTHFDHTVDMLPACASCFCQWHCAGDCAAKTCAEDLTDSGHYPTRCYINQELTRFLLLDRIEQSGGLLWHGPAHREERNERT
jgi:uncharacterized protein